MKNKFLTNFFIFILLSLFCSAATAAAVPEKPRPTLSPQPVKATAIQLEELFIDVNLYEEYPEIKAAYYLTNTSNKKTILTLKLPETSVLDISDGSAPELAVLNSTFKSSQKQNAYFWEIPFEPAQKLVLNFSYKANYSVVEKNIFTASVNWPAQNFWSGDAVKSSIGFYFNEINPGQIIAIQPAAYLLSDKALYWEWDGLPAGGTYTVNADINSEKSRWETSFSDAERQLLHQFLSVHNYQSAAFLFTNKNESSHIKDQPFLRVGQAYYLEKAGKQKEALDIWEELYADKSLSSYVYWYLGNKNMLRSNYLKDLYEQVRELQINPLLQKWLANMLPADDITFSPPEAILTKASVDKERNGLLIKGSFVDPDGDIDKITLRYRCEDNPYIEGEFELKPLEYSQNVSYFIPMEKSMQKVYYEFIVTDVAQNIITTEQKEVFFLTNEIQSTTYPLQGAKLVLGDYSVEEHEKVYKWFKSYLKMAAEVKFIPLGGRDPYFIFLGKPSDFIDSYHGPLFLKYTSAPFSPEATKLPVHKYFLSYWYGAGWEQVSDKEILKFGDALFLGQGSFVRILKYLKHYDQTHFYEVLEYIGQGNTWEQGINTIYKMSVFEINLRAYWYSYGNNLIAVVIILLFAWLGKNGYIARVIKGKR